MNCNSTKLPSGILAVVLLCLSSILSGCGAAKDTAGDTAIMDPLPVAADFVDQPLRPVAEYLSAGPYSTANLENGAAKAQLCRACHTFESGGTHMIGPNLNQVFGAETGANPGFDYSVVMQTGGFVWTPAAMEAFLRQPARFLPGNRMAFTGMTDDGDRTDLIAYLLHETSRQ